MSLEADIHKAAKRYMTKRQQVCFMEEVRKALAAAAAPGYDRNLIADMLDEYEKHGKCVMDLNHAETSIREQARLLRAADNADAAGVHTAKREDYPPTDHAA